MRGASVAGLYLFVSLLFGSLLAEILYAFLSYPFDRVLTRSVLLVMAVLLVPLSKIVSGETLGLTPEKGIVREFLSSFSIGLVVLIVPVFAFLLMDLRSVHWVLDIEPALVFPYLLLGVFVAGLIALFEEILFRGFLYGALRDKYGQLFAIVLSSALYSCAHFLKPFENAQYTPGWSAGFNYLSDSLDNAFSFDHQWDARLSLMLLGCFFCLIRNRLGLFWCIGFHAAFVFGITLTREFTSVNLQSDFLVLISSYNEFIGHFVSVWLFLLIGLLYWLSSVSSGVSRVFRVN